MTVEGDWFDKETRDKVNREAEKQGLPRPFDRKSDK